MNNDITFNLIDIDLVFNQLTSNNISQINEASRQIAQYLKKNRQDSEEIILRLSQFINSNLKNISLHIIIKIIITILKALSTNNNNQIIYIVKNFFPLIISMILYSNWSIEEYDLLTSTLGKIISKCISHSGQLVESHIDFVFLKCKSERMEFPYLKYALISLLKEFIKNSPVIAYNKLIETFDNFIYIVSYYRDSNEYIRQNTAEMVMEFLLLLNNRDFQIKEVYTKKIYSVIEFNLKSTNGSIFSLHGTILMLKAITVRREFFNEKFKMTFDFLYSLRYSKSQVIQYQIIDMIPFFGEYLKEEFEKKYFLKFSKFLLECYNSSSAQIIKNSILVSLGKLSIFISISSFYDTAKEIVNIIKPDFETNINSPIPLSEIDCLANLLVNYPELILNVVPFDILLNKIFLSGFYESHVKFLGELLLVFDDNSTEEIQILLLVLNVISLILSSKKFILNDTIIKLKSGSSSIITNNNSNDKKRRKKIIKAPLSGKTNSTSLLQNVRKSISTYINAEEKKKITFELNMFAMKKYALIFLKKIEQPFLAKDILTFYQSQCLRFIDDPLSKLKIETLSLATAPWIPEYFPTEKDPEIVYMLNTILDSYLNTLLINQNDDINKIILANLDERYDRLLSQQNFFTKFIMILNSLDNNIRESTVKILSRLVNHNSPLVISFIKKSVMEIFNTLQSGRNSSEKEEAIILLSYYVKYLGKYIIDYLSIVFTILIKLIKDEPNQNQNTEDSSISEETRNSNEILNIHILSIISELMNSHSFTENIGENELYYKDIMNICINDLKENSNSLNQEICLKTILSVLEHSGLDLNVYFNFIDLVNILIQILIKTNNKVTRLYGMKIFGFIGTMDPDKLDVLWSIHKNDNENNNLEDYEADEFENFDDEEIVTHNREQMKKKKKANTYKLNTQANKAKCLIDFEKKLSLKEIDACTYYTIVSLLNILNDDSQQEPCIQVVTILNDIIYFLEHQDKDKILIELILTRLLHLVNDYNGNLQLQMFKRILYIVKHFISNCVPHLPEIVELIEQFIEDNDIQETVFALLITLLEQYLDEMETYLGRLVPMLIHLLSENEDTPYERLWFIRTKVFQCFTYMSEKLSQFLGFIVPEMITLLNTSMIMTKNTKELDLRNNTTNSNDDIKTTSTSTMSNVNSSNNNNNMNNVIDNPDEMLRKEDMEIFAFINKIIPLRNFYEYMPKIVHALMKYMVFSPGAKQIIMGLFMKMLKHFRDDFLCYLPRILRLAKLNEINIIDYFSEINSLLEANEILLSLNNHTKVTSEQRRIKSKRSFDENESEEGSMYSNQTLQQSKHQHNKARLIKINKEEILNEFNPINCSIEEDWHEWFKSSSKQLFFQSPSYILFCCRNLSDYLLDLYNYAFISVWRTFNQYQKSKMISYLKIALCSHTTPTEILLTILNLSEFIEREENNIEFIEFDKLGEVAGRCNAYAKELYYTENDYKNNHNINSFESLITLYYELNLPESAMGILKMSQKRNKNIKEGDWYLKLHKWKEGLELIKQKRNKDKYNKDLIKGNAQCLEGLSDWESILVLGDEVETQVKDGNINKDTIIQMSPLLAKASLNLNEWDNLKHYITLIQPGDDEEEYEKNFFQAVVAIKQKQYKEAQLYIDIARDIIDDKIKTLLSESYERAYKILLSNEHLYQLEEVIKLHNTITSIINSKEEQTFKLETIHKEQMNLKHRWDERIEMITKDTNAYERILAIRSLVFPIEEDYDKHLDLAKICRKEDFFAKCMNILERLKKYLVNNKNILINLELSLSKCLSENDFAPDSQKAIDNLEYIINNEINTIDDNGLKSKIYCYYAFLNMQKYEKNLSEERVNSIMKCLELSTKYNHNNYKTWHYYAFLNYKYFEVLLSMNNKKKNIYAQNAIIGFTNSVCIGGKTIAKTLQDLLRIIEIWFQVGEDITVIKLIKQSFIKIDIDTWLQVLPQLLARVNTKNELIQESLIEILKLIGINHPSVLIYPLIVMHKSKHKIRSKTAGIILSSMALHNKQLITECAVIIDELNRCALLLHEKWTEAIEECAKLYFELNDIKGMISVLNEVHSLMEETPITMNEVHFHQLYYSELREAKSLLDDYLKYNNEDYIKQMWDIYHAVFLSMRDNFSNFRYIDLESVSPALATFKQSEICVPGLYRSDYPEVKIASFCKLLTVLNSKQHPRKITLHGSDGKEYLFLLKGHEDLRQDERAMQLFGLVNALLGNDVDTCDKNLFIKRFPVIALSNNTGILGWVPSCDTLSLLIKEYRASNNLFRDIEQRLMFTKYPKFESATFLPKLEVFKYVMDNTAGLDIYKILWIKSKNSEDWLDRRTNYSRSLAVMSIVGYILGLGDRHPSNLMLDRKSGKILHIDFGDCFEVAMKREKFPERVPFRLTRMLIKALEVSGIEGTFRITCENVMRVLRTNQDSLIAILSAFVHDPLISFRFLIPLIMKQNRKNGISTNTYSSTIITTNTKNASESLKEEIQPSTMRYRSRKVHSTQNEDEDKISAMNYEKRRLGSVERQLYSRFTEREQVESEDLNKIAKIVLGRINDKLKGTDFGRLESLDYKQQVEKLIRQATSHENLCQSYLGWCPFW